MLRDAEMPARDYVTLVTRGIGNETDVGLLQNHLRQAKIACDSFADPAWRTTGLLQLATAAYDNVVTAEPGSDHQLAWVRALASTATSDEHVGLLRELLSGDRSIDGLRIDVDLRWALLHRLVALGIAGDDEIDAELDRDRTATGERHAAMVRAAQPTAQAKADVWAAVVDSDDLPNALQRATVVGFQNADHRELLKPYVDRYFTSIKKVWDTRTPEMAQELIVNLFPSVVIEERTLEAADQWLRATDPEPTLRRLVVEGRATTERALKARGRDIEAAAGERAE
jgi:aminopeptidase N